MELLAHHPELGRLVRADDWEGLARGTHGLLARAIADGDRTAAAGLAGFFLTEARIIHDIYAQWRRDTRRYLADKGMEAAAIAAEEARVHALAVAGRPAAAADFDAAWAAVAALGAAAGAGDGAAAEAMRDLWRHLHDGQVDHLAGLFDVVIRRFGEPALGEMYEGWVIGAWFDSRYRRFDTSRVDWKDAFPLIVYLTFESMHGHLSGPGRRGDVAFAAFDDRVEFTFAPCGSGGRTVAGEPLDGSGPRMEPPFRWAALAGAHPFAWNMPGVCSYCAHCCVLTEKLPMERFGYPVRVVDPPVHPGDGSGTCRWTVYRDPALVPERVYARLGMRKPAPDALGSAAAGRR